MRILLLLCTATLARADYTVIDLANTYGFSSSAFNNAGDFTGARNQGGNKAFRWSSGSGFTNLGTLGGVGTSTGVAISNSGLIAGNSNGHAFLWQQGSGLTDLGTLGGSTSEARSINSAGNVVGRSTNSINSQRAFLWSAGNGMSDLGTLGGGSSQAFYITEGNRVVGSAQNSAGNSRPFLWTSADGMIDLGTLGGDFGTARGANDSGQVVGQARRADGSNGAFLWSNGSMLDLGSFGGSESGAFAINAAGQVVGFATDANDSSFAFIWDSINGMRNLNTLTPGSGFNFSSAVAINDLGQIIVQQPTEDGFTFMLLTPQDVPPETVPAPPAIVLAGIAVVMLRRKIRR